MGMGCPGGDDGTPTTAVVTTTPLMVVVTMDTGGGMGAASTCGVGTGVIVGVTVQLTHSGTPVPLGSRRVKQVVVTNAIVVRRAWNYGESVGTL